MVYAYGLLLSPAGLEEAVKAALAVLPHQVRVGTREYANATIPILTS